MPVPIPGGGFATLGAVAGPLMMLAMALSRPGAVRALLKVGADAPERARRAKSLGINEHTLEPLIRSGAVIREPDGCVWVDRPRAKARHRRILVGFGIAAVVLAGVVLFVLKMGG